MYTVSLPVTFSVKLPVADNEVSGLLLIITSHVYELLLSVILNCNMV